ncbi:MAG: hypothetical protein CMJ31_14790 [Phycisphaerae bacterium]|nr:hypothetical protein [Phycisphaerae bacterium]
MQNVRNALIVALVAGAAAPALAQDSVSAAGTGLPGDGPNAYDAADQVDNFVLDLVPISTSWGTEFGLGHLHKSPDVDGPSGFFGSLVSAQAISPDVIVAPLSGDFAFWETAGAGVTANNSAPQMLSVDIENAIQQATVFSAFSGDSNTINGSVIWLDPTDSTRLYVKRVLAANTQASVGAPASLALGVGGVDADGNVYFRGDGGATGTINNYVRTNLCDRSEGVFNTLTGTSISASDSASTSVLLTGTTTAHTVPQALPASVSGGAGVMLGQNFNDQYVFGSSSPMTATSTHLFGAGAPSGSTHRGAIASTPNTFAGFANPGAATLAILAKGGTPDSGATETINVWAVDASGAPVAGSRRLFDPTNGTITDNANGFMLNTVNGQSVHHYSQTGFNGGSAQVDVQVVPAADGSVDGDMIAVVTLGENQASRFDTDPDNYIVAFRETAAGVREETLVAYTSFVQGNKEILDGPGGSRVGEILPIDAAFAGTTGPSVSSPAIDSAGNVWFVAPFQLDSDEFADTGLFRAVYNPAAFSYELELVFRAGFGSGTTVTGANSGVPYQLQFISISDSNSISSGAFYSSNVSTAAALNLDPADFEPVDPETNGGVVVAVELVYDIAGDGDFEDPTSAAGDPSSLDESYTSLVYVGAMTTVDAFPGCNRADIGLPYGTLDIGDVVAFLTAFGQMNPLADIGAPMGTYDIGDVVAFLTLFGQGCPQ